MIQILVLYRTYTCMSLSYIKCTSLKVSSLLLLNMLPAGLSNGAFNSLLILILLLGNSYASDKRPKYS